MIKICKKIQNFKMKTFHNFLMTSNIKMNSKLTILMNKILIYKINN
jgi:hypothetical protein